MTFYLLLLLKSIYFIFLVLVLFLLPGFFIFSFLKLKSFLWEKIIVSLVLGIVFFTFSSFILMFFNLSPFLFFIFSLLGWVKVFLVFKRKKQIIGKSFLEGFFTEVESFWLWFLLLAGAITQNLVLFKSGIFNKDGDLIFLSDWAWHDFSWHLALIAELKRTVPPLNPVFKALPLTNYHYFYDLLLASFSKVSGINVLDLLYRFFPILISFLLGLSVYLACLRFSKSKTASLLSVFLTYFAGSFAFLIPFLSDKNQSWGESSLWVSQTFSMGIQPHFLFSLTCIMVGVILLPWWVKKQSFYLSLVVGFLFGLVFMFKSYGFLVSAGGLLVFGLYRLYKRNFKVILLGALVFLFSFLFLKGSGGEQMFFWSPLWYLKTLASSPDRLNRTDLILKEQHYVLMNNVLRVIQIKLVEFNWFFFGNLGVRVLGFLGIFLVFKKGFKRYDKNIYLFLLGCVVLAFIFPLLFLQTGAVWNSIQTWYYLLVFLNIFTSIFLVWVLNKFKGKKVLRGLVIVLLFVLILPTTIKAFYSANNAKDEVLINKEELEGLNFLASLKEGSEFLVLSYPEGRNASYSLLPAFSQKRSYFSHKVQVELFGYNSLEEKDKIKQVFTSNDQAYIKSFLKDNNIMYLFSWNKDSYPMSSSFKELLEFKFKNSQVSIYRFKIENR
jgi:hypothetical protein